MKNIFKVIFVIIGTLIGAGFISGQEMYTFFYSYGVNGMYGLVLCSFIFGFIIYKTLKICEEHDITDYKDFLKLLNKNSKRKYLNISYITNIIINIFLFITFCIMISGFGAFLNQEFGINSIVGSGIFAIICVVILLGNVQRIVKTSEILVPIIIIFIFIIGFFVIKNFSFNNLSNQLPLIENKFKWIISGTLYSSYNIILLVPILVTLKPYIKKSEDKKYISIISGLSILILATILFLLLTQANADISNVEMPTAYVISLIYPAFEKIYGIIILISIFTTAISLGVSFLKNTTKTKKSYTQIALIMCITSVALSNIGFSNLINLLYPIFGVLGLVQIISLILYK